MLSIRGVEGGCIRGGIEIGRRWETGYQRAITEEVPRGRRCRAADHRPSGGGRGRGGGRRRKQRASRGAVCAVPVRLWSSDWGLPVVVARQGRAAHPDLGGRSGAAGGRDPQDQPPAVEGQGDRTPAPTVRALRGSRGAGRGGGGAARRGSSRRDRRVARVS